ncbi:hypothetical protein [Flagellimonas meridianipacifica]|uniref:Secreted protein n=1 Tax=Flagellimonas meridianipacifica TaxID=1080225 RepID=A0A2T0M858_9FLAO|nr:hypothetical protein [Allomuricauda pacifica]PRX53691.1 hypothetical protein CLV81_2078 [Allomuricauda pacifica]
MKRVNGKVYLLSLALAVSTISTAQLGASNFSASNADLDASGRNPRLDFAFQQVRNQKPIEKKIKIQGSAYFHEDYRKASIYSGDGIEGVLFLRYDGFRDQFEIKPTTNNEETQVLLPREDIYCVLDGKTAKFKSYNDKKGKFKQGYLFILADLEDMILYERQTKLFKEGKEARTSLELNVPNRFVESRQLFLGKKNGDEEEIQFFKTSKKEVYALFDNEPEASKKIKQFVSKNRLNLKETADVAKVFRYYNTL